MKNEYCEIQAVAAIGVALVAMSEDTGSEMCQRIFGHMVLLFSVKVYNPLTD